ncbi:acyltransferase family protein [Hansschlegelia plantiphila]|uniref:Acyltransferase n=1 Tax=Hansschlegelia plantiphila TaxID=374655 RepID=A0A9W6IYH1_9HYPH|nr:acyltransferase [Hansschlegelia plantiphila]GLK67456.1 acyltransferase [Hansschlegelia plantiphila]
MANGQTLQPGRLLPEFVATRGIAAVWVVLAHTLAATLRGHMEVPAPVEYTRLVVDFFFVQSGFVLAHIYDPAWREGRFRYLEFLGKRLTRLWPLHVATLLAVAVLVVAGRLVGIDTGNPHTMWTFGVTFLMLHSAWLTSDLAWNWPSWSVSAEWCAYLAIPGFFLCADRVRGTLWRATAALAVFVAAAAVAELFLGQNVVALTFDGGAFRIAPSFFAGILLRRIFDEEPSLLLMTPRIYAGFIAAIAAVCVILVAMNAPYDALWPPMVVLVGVLASRSARAGPGLLRGRALAWLGELSYAIYLTHAIVLQVVFTGAKFLGLADSLPNRALLGCVSVFATLAAAQFAYVLVEKPGRGVMVRLLQRNKPEPALAKTEKPGVTT